MKRLLDYLPALAFVVLYFGSNKDIYLATGGMLIACVIQIVAMYLLWKKVEQMHLLVFAITLVFGGLTLALRDPLFIMWRPTIIYFVLGTVLIVGVFMHRSFLQRLIEAVGHKSLEYVPPFSRQNWQTLNWICIGYFFFLGTLNIIVAYQFSEATWVNVKIFGFTILNLLFYPILFTIAYRMLSPEQRAELLEHLNGDNSKSN